MQQALSFLAWHYTTAARFLQILKQRALIPASGADSAHGRPVIWFSVNDDFEPSACLVTRADDGSARHYTVNETAESGQGLVRLGVPVRTLLTCTELRRKAMMSGEAWAGLCEDARSVGSDPDQWFGCMRSVPLRDCVVEVRDDDGQWRRMQTASVSAGGGSAGGARAHRPSREGRAARRRSGSGADDLGSHHLVGR